MNTPAVALNAAIRLAERVAASMAPQTLPERAGGRSTLKKYHQYVKSPAEAPAGVPLVQGTKGGIYYETEGVPNAPADTSKPKKKKQPAQQPGVQAPSADPAAEPPAYFPDSLDQLHGNKPLGGSTGATQKEHNGQQYVVKEGASPEHLKNEMAADRAYEALGIATAPFKEFTNDQGKPVKVAKFVAGKDLRHIEEQGTPEEIKAAHSELARSFVAHALLANWDAHGMDGDNVIFDDQGTAHFIDNGGALEFRAQGAPKGDKFGTHVGELDSLLDPSINPSTAAIFGELSNAEIAQQVVDISAKESQLLAALPEKLRPVMKARLADLREQTGVSQDAAKPESPEQQQDEPQDVHAPAYHDLVSASLHNMTPEELSGIKAGMQAAGVQVIADPHSPSNSTIKSKDGTVLGFVSAYAKEAYAVAPDGNQYVAASNAESAAAVIAVASGVKPSQTPPDTQQPQATPLSEDNLTAAKDLLQSKYGGNHYDEAVDALVKKFGIEEANLGNQNYKWTDKEGNELAFFHFNKNGKTVVEDPTGKTIGLFISPENARGALALALEGGATPAKTKKEPSASAPQSPFAKKSDLEVPTFDALHHAKYTLEHFEYADNPEEFEALLDAAGIHTNKVAPTGKGVELQWEVKDGSGQVLGNVWKAGAGEYFVVDENNEAVLPAKSSNEAVALISAAAGVGDPSKAQGASSGAVDPKGLLHSQLTEWGLSMAQEKLKAMGGSYNHDVEKIVSKYGLKMGNSPSGKAVLRDSNDNMIAEVLCDSTNNYQVSLILPDGSDGGTYAHTEDAAAAMSIALEESGAKGKVSGYADLTGFGTAYDKFTNDFGEDSDNGALGDLIQAYGLVTEGNNVLDGNGDEVAELTNSGSGWELTAENGDNYYCSSEEDALAVLALALEGTGIPTLHEKKVTEATQAPAQVTVPDKDALSAAWNDNLLEEIGYYQNPDAMHKLMEQAGLHMEPKANQIVALKDKNEVVLGFVANQNGVTSIRDVNGDDTGIKPNGYMEAISLIAAASGVGQTAKPEADQGAIDIPDKKAIRAAFESGALEAAGFDDQNPDAFLKKLSAAGMQVTEGNGKLTLYGPDGRMLGYVEAANGYVNVYDHNKEYVSPTPGAGSRAANSLEEGIAAIAIASGLGQNNKSSEIVSDDPVKHFEQTHDRLRGKFSDSDLESNYGLRTRTQNKIARSVGHAIDTDLLSKLDPREIDALEDAFETRNGIGNTAAERLVSVLVDSWAADSSDHRKLSVAMQDAVSEVLSTPNIREQGYKVNAQTNSDVEQMLAVPHAREALNLFVKHTYEQTQADLAKRGLTEMTLVRGFHYTNARLPSWLKSKIGVIPDQPMGFQFQYKNGYSGKTSQLTIKAPISKLSGNSEWPYATLTDSGGAIWRVNTKQEEGGGLTTGEGKHYTFEMNAPPKANPLYHGTYTDLIDDTGIVWGTMSPYQLKQAKAEAASVEPGEIKYKLVADDYNTKVPEELKQPLTQEQFNQVLSDGLLSEQVNNFMCVDNFGDEQEVDRDVINAQLVGQAKITGEETVGMNPISSFSTKFGTAKSFATDGDVRMMGMIRVPASRIFSTYNTGPGCMNEQEVTVLGGDQKMQILGVGQSGAYLPNSMKEMQLAIQEQQRMSDINKAIGDAPPKFFIDEDLENSNWIKRGANDRIPRRRSSPAPRAAADTGTRDAAGGAARRMAGLHGDPNPEQ